MKKILTQVSQALALKERYVIGQCVSAVYQKVTSIRGLKDRHVYTCRTYGAHKLQQSSFVTALTDCPAKYRAYSPLRHTKLVILTLLAILIPALLSAQETTTDRLVLSAASALTPGDSDVKVTVSIDGSQAYTGYQMDITLPEGIELSASANGQYKLAMDKSGNMYPMEEDWQGNTSYTHSVKFTYGEVAANTMRITCTSTSNQNLEKNSGKIVMFYLKATSSAKPGAAPLAISNCKLITYDASTATTIGYEVQQTALSGINVNAKLNISSDIQWSTIMLPFSTSIPTGILAYTCSKTDGSNLVLSAAETIVAYTPYILRAQNGFNGIIPFQPEAERPATDIVTVGYLNGAVTQQTITEGYVLQKLSEGVMFYTCAGNTYTIPQGKCWVTVPSSSAKGYGFSIEGATAIDAVTTVTSSHDTIFSLSGQRVAAMVPGTPYIVNGKKIICQ